MYFIYVFLNIPYGQIVYCQACDSSLSWIDDYLRHYRVQQRLESKELLC
jgi:twitching motility two-component system response regulator PilG